MSYPSVGSFLFLRFLFSLLLLAVAVVVSSISMFPVSGSSSSFFFHSMAGGFLFISGHQPMLMCGGQRKVDTLKDSVRSASLNQKRTRYNLKMQELRTLKYT